MKNKLRNVIATVVRPEKIITESRPLKNVTRELNASEKPEVNIQVSRKTNCFYF